MANVIPEAWSVPARFRQRVGAHAGRQRAMVEEGHLLLILHEVPSEHDLQRSAKVFWRAPEGTWRASGSGQSNGMPVLKRHLDGFQQAITALDDIVDRNLKQGAVRPEPFFEVITKATPLLRTARHLAKALQEAREGVDDRDIITLRDQAGDLERAVELVLTDAKNALDFSMAKNAEAQAEQGRRAVAAQHKLNLLAALFFPVTAVGSVLGTNLTTGLEGHGAWVYWLLIAMSFVFGLLLRGTVAK